MLFFDIPKMAIIFSREEGRSPWWFVFDFLRNYMKFGIQLRDYVDARNKADIRDRDASVEKLVSYPRYFRIWQDDFFKRAKFLAKYSHISTESSLSKRLRRRAKYREFFGLGPGCLVGYNVIFTKAHPSDGILSVGGGVIFARNIEIDFTGGVEIGDDVGIAEGVKIMTHEHDHFKLQKEDRILPGPDRVYKCPLRVGRNARLGAHCIIMPGVGEIGEGAVIGVGEIVRRKVPPFHMVRDGKMVKIIH